MLRDSQLNVYVVGSDLSPRLRERLQAQVQSALRALPPWAFALLGQRLERLGQPSFTLVVEPQREAAPKALTFGTLGEKPAVRLLPLLRGEAIDWRQDRRYLAAKAVAYLCTPGRDEDKGFWSRWEDACRADDLPGRAAGADQRWRGATPLDLLIEMFAAYALNAKDERWSQMPSVRRFFEEWVATASGAGPRS
ncbi:MAG: hypothetical protein HYS09_02480 [Chloroflexi bacterium]|nr:hypothetical protein [Chloroflexota bacterium]